MSRTLTAVRTQELGLRQFGIGFKDGSDSGRHSEVCDDIQESIEFYLPVTITKGRSTRSMRSELLIKTVKLNKRELQTLTWAARGKTSAEIAEIIGLSKRTVDFHIDRARLKLGTDTRIEAVAKGISHGVIKP
jgi:DNA-binding CsgD family transcriptional regulator